MSQVNVAIFFGSLIFLWLLFVRRIPNDRVGILEKLFSGNGSVRSGLIALSGEAGFQPDVLRGGLKLLMPFQFRVHIMPLVTIPQGKIGYVFARDGKPLPPSQTLASNLEACDFQDAAIFLRNGGQRGPQRQILREGTYAINLAQFVVITENELYYLPLNREEEGMFRGMADLIAERGGFHPIVLTGDVVGIVTVHDGPALPPGEIVAPIVGDDRGEPQAWHNTFQDSERFLAAGGKRGRQLQALVEGTYYINRLFATVEMIPKTVVDVGYVGVVVSYTGDLGMDLSGTDYKHGEMVSRGSRGVWSEPLMPGKYAFNTYAGKVVLVPTTNFILKWKRQESGVHKFDENLAEISLITQDAFEPQLPLSVVVHIDYRKAPLVVQRFGDIKRLVDQTLDPMVAAYFKNTAQTRTLIQLIHERSLIQKVASEEMKDKFLHYNLELEEVLIGTPASSEGDRRIDDILAQLRERQIAREKIDTYAEQEKAACQERVLREAEARAGIQQQLTASELSIKIQENQGKADLQKALQQADQIRAMADAEAAKVRKLAEARAEETARVGMAQAIAIDEQVRAYGGPRFQLTQQVMSRFAEAVEKSGVELVPRIVMGGANGNGKSGGSNMLETLLALMLSEKVGDGEHLAVERRPEAVALRDQVLASLQ